MVKKRGSIREKKKELKKIYSSEETKDILKKIRPERISPGKRRLEAISRNLFPVIFIEENGKKYVHYCSFHQHSGIMGEEYFKKECNYKQNCNHYGRLYLNGA